MTQQEAVQDQRLLFVLEALDDLGEEATGGRELPQLLAGALRQILALVGGGAGAIHALEGARLERAAARGETYQATLALAPGEDERLAWIAGVRSGADVALACPGFAERNAAAMAAMDTWAWVPLAVGGRLVGLLVLGGAASRPYDEADRLALQVAGRQLALAIACRRGR